MRIGSPLNPSQHTIVIDFLSGFPEARETKHTDCLVAIDKFTKWVVAVPCRRNPTAAGTAQLLMKGVFQTFRIPEVIISDRGPQFTSKTWEEIMRVMRVDNRLATLRHAQTSGQVERANSIICYGTEPVAVVIPHVPSALGVEGSDRA